MASLEDVKTVYSMFHTVFLAAAVAAGDDRALGELYDRFGLAASETSRVLGLDGPGALSWPTPATGG